MFIDSICIVGGGSAGWMTAATFSKIFPEKKITLIDSADLPPIGVGESTTQFIRDWMKFIDLKDEDWMNDCDATYKYSVRFENFNKPSVPFHYPFIADINGFNLEEKNASQWFIHQAITGESVDGFAEWFCPQMKAIHENRIITKNFDRFDHFLIFNRLDLRPSYIRPSKLRRSPRIGFGHHVAITLKRHFLQVRAMVSNKLN